MEQHPGTSHFPGCGFNVRTVIPNRLLPGESLGGHGLVPFRRSPPSATYHNTSVDTVKLGGGRGTGAVWDALRRWRWNPTGGYPVRRSPSDGTTRTIRTAAPRRGVIGGAEMVEVQVERGRGGLCGNGRVHRASGEVMRFIHDRAPGRELTYSDVFLVPSFSDVGSRMDVDLASPDRAGLELPLAAAGGRRHDGCGQAGPRRWA